MISCKKATELIEKEEVVKLPVMEKLQLRFHLYLCKACSTYKSQSKLINTFLQEYFTGSSGKVIINDDLRKRILERLIKNK